MRSRASDSRLWIGRRRRRETSRRQFESARGYPSYVARIGNAFGKTGNRQGVATDESATSRSPSGSMPADQDIAAAPLLVASRVTMKTMSASMVGSKSLMGADEVVVCADLEVHPLRIPAQDLSHPFRHHRSGAHTLVRRFVEETQPADQHVRDGHGHLFIHRDVHLRPCVRGRRQDSFSGGRTVEEPAQLLRPIPTLEVKGGLLVETKARELVERTEWRAERTIPRGA